jgi:hypothetical protein
VFGDAALLGDIEGLVALVLLLLVAALIFMLRRTLRMLNRPVESLGARLPLSYGLSHKSMLNDALDDAVALNAFSVHARSDPSVRLHEAVRFEPKTFDSAVRDVLQVLRAGRVVSVDVALMEESQAVRLVDFCSGMTAMSSGWMFRVTNNVVILTPS